MPKFTVILSEEQVLALERLSQAEARTKAAQVRYMITQEAIKRGFWTPRRPQVVKSTAQ